MIDALRRRLGRRARPRGPQLGAVKLRALEHACGWLGCRSIADLGGVWAVDGGYSIHALDDLGAKRVVICDDHFTHPLVARARWDPRVELVEGNLGSEHSVTSVGQVDAVLLFDVLLHQVDPDWDRVLELYAPTTDAFVLAGPWWNGSETVRLIELGRERYLDNVPLREFHAEAWDKLDQENPRRGRPWRDCHDIWQWGITEADLSARMDELGFVRNYRDHAGPWMGLEGFDEIGFVYARRYD